MNVKKIMIVLLILALAVPVIATPAFAAKSKITKGVVDVGNKICPVSGDPVSGKNFVIYKGKRYGLCCPMCKRPFLKDPAKYIAQMEAKEKVSASTATVTPVVSKSETAPMPGMQSEKKTV